MYVCGSGCEHMCICACVYACFPCACVYVRRCICVDIYIYVYACVRVVIVSVCVVCCPRSVLSSFCAVLVHGPRASRLSVVLCRGQANPALSSGSKVFTFIHLSSFCVPVAAGQKPLPPTNYLLLFCMPFPVFGICGAQIFPSATFAPTTAVDENNYGP